MLHIIQYRNSCSVLTIADNGNVIEFVTLVKFWFNLVQMYNYSILSWGQNSAKFSEIKCIIRRVSQWEDNAKVKWNGPKGQRVAYTTLHSRSSNDSKYSMHSNDETFWTFIFVRTSNDNPDVFDRKYICVINIQELSRYMIPQTCHLSQVTLLNIIFKTYMNM